MTAKNRGDIQTEIDTLLADNTSGDISAADSRTIHETSKDSNLNIVETASQSVPGAVDFLGDIQRDGKSLVPFIKQIPINVLSDLPAPVAGVITGADNTHYIAGDDINFGSNRFVFGQRTGLSGFSSLNITFTYTGTGDFFTMNDVRTLISGAAIFATSGRVFNWTGTTVNQRMTLTDVSIFCDRFGTFTGNLSALQFNTFFASVATEGMVLNGTFISLACESMGASIASGTLIDLGTATFDSVNIDKVLPNLSAGTTFISGLVDSGNIAAGGIGVVNNTIISGAGTELSGITPDDALWEFDGNDKIRSSMPYALLSMQANATVTVIAASGVPVLIAGTWTVVRESKFTGDAAGKVISDLGKDASINITCSVSVAPVSGTDIKIAVFVAIGGTVVTASKVIGSASNGDPTAITVPWLEIVAPLGEIELFVANEDSTVDLLVSSATYRLS